MIDVFILCIYLLLVLFVGLYSRSNSSNFKYYSNVFDSSQNNLLILIATIFVASIGGGTVFGLAEKVFVGNLSYSYGLILTIPVDILVAIYIVPRIAKYYGTDTIGDIMAKYYGISGRIISGVSVICISIGFLAAQISVSARIFQYALNIDYILCTVISYSILVIYTTVGGFRSVIFTNLLQFFAITIAIPVLTIVGIQSLGLYKFISSIDHNQYNIFDNKNLISDTISIALGFAVISIQPTFIKRILINKNPSFTIKAIYIKSAIYLLFLILVTLNGLLAFHFYPDQPKEIALLSLIDNIMPLGIKGLVIVGFFAAVMSTADSDLNIISITCAKDIFYGIYKWKNQKKLLMTARIINVAIGSASIYVALLFDSVIDLVIFMSGFWSSFALVPFIFAVFDLVISKKNMLFCSICGFLGFLLWELCISSMFNTSLRGVFIGVVINVCLFTYFLLITDRFKVK
ncbi:MAG: sodium:solute symporter [Rickettsiaceae bacterium]